MGWWAATRKTTRLYDGPNEDSGVVRCSARKKEKKKQQALQRNVSAPKGGEFGFGESEREKGAVNGSMDADRDSRVHDPKGTIWGGGRQRHIQTSSEGWNLHLPTKGAQRPAGGRGRNRARKSCRGKGGMQRRNFGAAKNQTSEISSHKGGGVCGKNQRRSLPKKKKKKNRTVRVKGDEEKIAENEMPTGELNTLGRGKS